MHLRFGLPAELPAPVKAAIKRADRVSAWLEAVQIAGFAAAEANRFFGAPRVEGLGEIAIRLRAPAAVKADFLARHAELCKAWHSNKISSMDCVWNAYGTRSDKSVDNRRAAAACPIDVRGGSRMRRATTRRFSAALDARPREAGRDCA